MLHTGILRFVRLQPQNKLNFPTFSLPDHNEEMRIHLSKVSLAGIQRNYGGVMRGEHLPEEGEGLSEGCCGPQICRWQLYLHRQTETIETIKYSIRMVQTSKVTL